MDPAAIRRRQLMVMPAHRVVLLPLAPGMVGGGGSSGGGDGTPTTYQKRPVPNVQRQHTTRRRHDIASSAISSSSSLSLSLVPGQDLQQRKERKESSRQSRESKETKEDGDPIAIGGTGMWRPHLETKEIKHVHEEKHPTLSSSAASSASSPLVEQRPDTPNAPNDDVHARTAELKSNLEQLLRDKPKFIQHWNDAVDANEWDTLLDTLRTMYGETRHATLTNIDQHYTAGFIRDPELCDGVNIARLLLEIVAYVQDSACDAAYRRGFGTVLDQIGTTCIQGISHRIIAMYFGLPHVAREYDVVPTSSASS